jgi:hypothetical protein
MRDCGNLDNDYKETNGICHASLSLDTPNIYVLGFSDMDEMSMACDVSFDCLLGLRFDNSGKLWED